MKAVRIVDSEFQYSTTTPLPTHCSSQDPSSPGFLLLIRVSHIGVNRLDLLWKAGFLPMPESRIIGVEVSGIVERFVFSEGTEESGELSESSERFHVGDRVCALVSHSAYAEFVLAEVGHCMKVPESVSLAESAGIPEPFLTAFQCIVFVAKKNISELSGLSVLIHAGASSVGQALCQICRLAGCRDVITTSSERKLAVCRSAGSTCAIPRDSDDGRSWLQILKERRPDALVDLIIDCVGQAYFEMNYEVSRLDASWVYIAALSGSAVPSFDIVKMMRKRLTLGFTTLKTRSSQYKARLVRSFWEFSDGLEVFGQGDSDSKMFVRVDATFSLEKVEVAHAMMKSNQNSGKILLRV